MNMSIISSAGFLKLISYLIAGYCFYVVGAKFYSTPNGKKFVNDVIGGWKKLMIIIANLFKKNKIAFQMPAKSLKKVGDLEVYSTSSDSFKRS